MGYRDWLTLNTQMMSAFLDLVGINFHTRCQFLTLYSTYGVDASLNKLLLLLVNQLSLTSIYHSCVYPWEYWITVPSSDEVFAACSC